MQNRIEKVTMEHNIPVQVVAQAKAPQCTRFKIVPQRRTKANGQPGQRVRVSWITSRARDIALGLGVPSVRITQGWDGLFLEVPRRAPRIVRAQEVLPVPWGRLVLPLGVSAEGAITLDLEDSNTPHLLVAGTTGSGKSVCIRNIIASIAEKHTPEDVQLVLFDFKGTELFPFTRLPHVMQFHESVETVGDVLLQMRRNIERRERLMQRRKANRVTPAIILIFDEYQDAVHKTRIGFTASRFEWLLQPVAAKGRASNVHLILSTQRPSAKVVTPLIRANIPARIAFRTASASNSRIILDQSGAEKLMGKGDALLLHPGLPEPIRFQGICRSEHELAELVQQNRRPWWRRVLGG